MKKFLSIILSATILAGCVSCSNKNTSSGTSTADLSLPAVAEGKTVITVAATVTDSYIDDMVSEINRESDNYYVTLVKYESSGDEDPLVGGPINDLNLDIVAGRVPDIVVGYPQDVDKLRRRGYLADIYPLMENYPDGTQKEDFLPNVIESLEVDGELPALYNRFLLYTAVAKSKFYDESYTNWTLDQAIEAYNSLPDNMAFIGDIYSPDMLDFFVEYFIRGLALECVDLENNTCDFGGEFKKALEFLVNISDYEVKMPYREYECGYIFDDTSLIKQDLLPGINSYVAQELYAMLDGENFTFVGYPSSYGNGAYEDVPIMYGIMASSANKDAAWEVLSTQFGEGVQRDAARAGGIPVISQWLYHAAETSEDASYSINSQVFARLEQGNEDGYYITEEAKQKIVEYVSTVRIEPYMNPYIFPIVFAECCNTFNGDQTVDECVEILNNRIGIMLAENG